MTAINLELPPKLIPVFSGEARYRGSWGGRGSGKTHTFAKMTAVRGYIWAENKIPGMILCAREYMNSLSDSSFEEVAQAIKKEPWLNAYYDVGEKYIRTRNRLITYGFAGLTRNLDSIKSKAKVLLCWVDEAEGVSDAAWRKLIPTVRAFNSEIWLTWNPEIEESATDKRFRRDPPPNSKIVELNHSDNPWFKDTPLEDERLHDQSKLDQNMYDHIWEGAYLNNSDKQVLAGKWQTLEFKPNPNWSGPYFGIDWGFANDPTAGVKCWIDDANNDLYIEYEAGRTKLELDETAEYLIKRIPEIENHTVYADCARPESIVHVNSNGMGKVQPCKKWTGSVEDGIAYLRSFNKIYIHTRCKEVKKEAQMYSYKVDKNSGDVMPQIVDAFNHYMDALRYALGPMIRNRHVSPTHNIRMR